MVCEKRIESIFDGPTCDQVESAKKQINENHERMEVTVDMIQQWTQRQHGIDLAKNVIRNYLRGAKHDAEKAKRKLENYFACKHHQPEIFSDRIPTSEQFQKAMNTVNIVFLPKLSQKGERISVHSLADYDPVNFESIPLSKQIFMIIDLLMTSESPVSGEIVIFDAAGTTATHLLKFIQPTLARSLFTILPSSYCLRIKSIHIVNAPPTLEKVLAIIRPLCHEKIRNRFVVHKNYDSLHQHVPSQLLPKDLGGELDSIKVLYSKWRQIIEANADWFAEQEIEFRKYRSKGKSDTTVQQSSDVVGTFRKLAID